MIIRPPVIASRHTHRKNPEAFATGSAKQPQRNEGIASATPWPRNDRLILLLVFLSLNAHSYEISRLRTEGEKDATVVLETNETQLEAAKVEVKGNEVLFFLDGATLDPEMKGYAVVAAPHPLIDKGEFQEEKKGVQGHFWINGPEKELKDRITLSTKDGVIRLLIKAPEKNSATLDLLKEEQKPLAVDTQKTKEASPWKSLWILLALLTVAGAGTYFILRFLKSKSVGLGKKYLIEQLAYLPVGTKSGLSLVRVGKEFMLLGVTPQAIRLVSNLPSLSAQYEDETKFERAQFQDVVEDEIARLKKQIAL